MLVNFAMEMSAKEIREAFMELQSALKEVQRLADLILKEMDSQELMTVEQTASWKDYKTARDKLYALRDKYRI